MKPPKLPSNPLKNIKAFSNTPAEFITKCVLEYGDVIDLNVSLWLQPRFFIVSNPDFIQHILVKNNRNYKKDSGYNFLKIPLGEGLLTSEGDFWEKQRKIIQPTFHGKRLRLLSDKMTEEVNKTVKHWKKDATLDKPIDLSRDMLKLTTRVAARSLFSTDMDRLEDKIVDLVSTLNTCIANKFKSFIQLPKWIPSKENRVLWKALKEFDQIIFSIIQSRRISNGSADDLLQMLMEVKDEDTRVGMNDKQLRDEVATLLAAGSETTASALVWVFYLLSKNKDAKKKVYLEIQEVLKGQPPTIENIRELSYLQQVIQETMRLYPPAWILGREALQDDKLGNYDIPKGSQVFICAYTIHRHPNLWTNPLKFIPERFNNEKANNRHKYSFFPFGAGPRVCIGGEFAKMEMLISLSIIFQNFNFEIDTSGELVLEELVTLHPKNKISTTLELIQ